MAGPDLPVINMGPLVEVAGPARARDDLARRIDEACQEAGFFSVIGHGIDLDLFVRLERAARAFFRLDEEEKAAIAMDRGGRAWRGWFPVGGELTSGVPDGKEGIYFGAELGADDARVRAGWPLHGPNLFPDRPVELRTAVLAWLEAMTGLGHALMGGIALALGLERDWFAHHLTADPLVLFRVFHYPATVAGPADPAGWGVAEHTDYGLLTILAQDETGGLEVRSPAGWVEVEPTPGSLVCNLGDMLERMTAGRYRSTPHRVRRGSADRVSFPFFFDPAWDAEVRPVPGLAPGAQKRATWDGVDLHAWTGTYGDYLRAKVARVFPELGQTALGRP